MGALCQAAWIGVPATALPQYLALWIGVASLAMILIGTEAVTRSRRLHSALADEMIVAAAAQFMPALVAGALLSAVLLQWVPDSAALLPGLWQVTFALGVFAASRFLPRATSGRCAGTCSAAWPSSPLHGSEAALSPWCMGLPFGAGQLGSAILLHRALGGGRV